MLASLLLALALGGPAEPEASGADAESVVQPEGADGVDEDDLFVEADGATGPEAAPTDAAREPAVAEDPPPPSPGPYAAGFSAEAQAGIGVGRRRVGPVAEAGTGGVAYPQATPVAEVAIRIGGVPQRARAIEVFGTAGLRSAFASRIEVTSETGTPRRPRARSLRGLLAVGVLAWPRALRHRLGVGGELAYGLYPFLVESKVGVPSFLLHGPLVAARIEGELARSRVLLALRPFVGAALTDRTLRAARYHNVGLQWGVSAQIAVRVYGFVHVYVNYSERHAPLPYGNGGAIDDLERAGVLGLMIRGTRDPKRKN